MTGFLSLAGRRRLGPVLLLIALMMLGAAPAAAEVGRIDPDVPPPPLFAAADYAKLIGLRSIGTPLILTELSPDETTFMGVVTSNSEAAVGFFDINTLAVTRLDTTTYPRPLTLDFRWRDNDNVVYIGIEPGVGIVEAIVSRSTLAMRSRPLALPGYPFALSPDGRTLVVLSEPGGRPNPTDLRAPFETPPWQGQPTPAAAALRGWLHPQAVMPSEGAMVATQATTSLDVQAFDLATQQTTPLYTVPPSTQFIAHDWSDDSSRLAIVRADAGPPGSRLTGPAARDALGQLAPASNPLLQSNVVDIINVTAGSARPAALKATSYGGETFAEVVWAPDNQVLAAKVFVPSQLAGREHPIYLLPERAFVRFLSADGAALGTLDRAEIEAPGTLLRFISNDELVLTATVGWNRTLFTYSRSSAALRGLLTPPGAVVEMRPTPALRQIFFIHSSVTSAPEAYRINLDGSGLLKLTTFNDELAGRWNRVRSDEVRFTLDGRDVTGLLIQPAEAPFPPSNVPVVVWQEGGPFTPMLNRFSTSVHAPLNLLPNYGTAVLLLPLYGRYGYGIDRYRALYAPGAFGSLDVDATAAAVRQMIERGWTAPGKVGVTGCSYGGYFAAQSIARHPDLYAAANPQCTLVDPSNEWEFGSRSPTISYVIGAAPTAAGAEYLAASPLLNSARIRSATLLFQGAIDFLALSQVELMHEQIRANGASTNLIVFAKEGHTLMRETSQLVAAEMQIDWFRRYLGPR